VFVSQHSVAGFQTGDIDLFGSQANRSSGAVQGDISSPEHKDMTTIYILCFPQAHIPQKMHSSEYFGVI
jgi:hypothetical protein